MEKAKRSGGKSTKATKVARRDKDGTFMGIRIVDPPVKPRGVTVQQIRRAVETVMARRKRA